LIQALTEDSQIEIQEGVIVQDLTVIKASQGQSTIIKRGALIGSNSTIENSTIGENCVVGYGSTISRNCKLGRNSMLGAGSILPPGTVVPDNQVWLGSPAQYSRDTEIEDLDILKETQVNY
jgi:carbonic anhydrase/acetyltransferase-like protein (isoleucine patch superfamily)